MADIIAKQRWHDSQRNQEFWDWSRTFEKWSDENLYQKFRESREVITSIVWQEETVLQLANQHGPDSAHAAFHATVHLKMCVWRAQCVAERRQQNITPET